MMQEGVFFKNFFEEIEKQIQTSAYVYDKNNVSETFTATNYQNDQGSAGKHK